MFTSPQNQLDKIRNLNKSESWGFTDKHFKAVENVPKQPTGELQTVVLVPYFSTIGRTIDTLWSAIEKEYDSTWRWDKIKSDRLKLHKGIHPKKQLKWVALDFSVNHGISVKQARKTDYELAGVEVLAAALLHPEWVKATNGDEVKYADIGNITLTVPGFSEPHALYLHWNPINRGADFNADPVDDVDDSWASPVVLPRETLEFEPSELSLDTSSLELRVSAIEETLAKLKEVL